MPSLGTAYVAIKADIKTLKPGLDKARKTVGSSVDGMLNKISQITFRAAIVGAAAFSAAVVYNLKKSVDAASNLQEVTSKFETVFKNQIPIAEKWSKELVAGYAMSTREAKQYLSSVQDLLVPMGMQAEAAGRMSNEVVKLSADLASFNNVPTAQAMADIQSALVGNFETMKKYGVILNETVIKQEALAQGLWNGKGMVDANTKAQVAFELMLRGSAAALGDQQKTMGSYANQMKQLTANLEEIRAKIGESLLPALTEIVLSMNEWVKVNKELIGPEFKEWLEAVNPLFKVFAATASIAAQAVGGIGVIVGALGDITPRRPGVTGSWGEPDQPGIGSDQTEKDTAQQKAIAKSLEIDALGNEQALAAEYIRWEQVLEIQEKAMDDSLKIRAAAILQEKEDAQRRAEFDQQYAEMGKSRFEIERMQLEQQAEAWRQHGVDKTQIAKLTADKMAAINKAEAQQRISNIQNVAGSMADNFKMISEMGGKHSKEAFAMYKAFKITETLISTYSGAMKAFEALAPIPIVGPALGIAAAAMVTGFGLAQVAMIKSSQPPSYETGTDYVPETGLALLHKGEQVIPSNRVPMNQGGQQGTVVNINMTNPVFQDLATQRQVFAAIASEITMKIAPSAVKTNYDNDGIMRSMVRGRI